ncbi:MAG: alpha/beta hydrolase [Paracoccaceae bacterium]|nr:alpha/beta hydrolase [Paracoccaceae bacterium]
MPLLQVNAEGTNPRTVGGESRLAGALAALPMGAPVVVMIHGFRFSPTVPGQSPHTHILALDPNPGCWKALSWPRALGFGQGHEDEGLCVAFGWEARGTIWRAYHEAAAAATALARLLGRIEALRPGTRADIVAHSLGARVALQAMPLLSRPLVRHAILLAAAEFRRPAARALDCPAARGALFVNVTSGENDLFDFLIERLVPRWPDRALGLGTGQARPNWIDLQLDHPDTLQTLAALGHPVAPADRRICHWSLYLRPGIFSVYRALLRGDLAFGGLRARVDGRRSRRWSRLVAPPRRTAGLPCALEQST